MTQSIVSITRGPDGRPVYGIQPMALAIRRPTEDIRLVGWYEEPAGPPIVMPTACGKSMEEATPAQEGGA
jgi:hypothetical protein